MSMPGKSYIGEFSLNGFTLIEALVAMSILLLVLSASIPVVLRTIMVIEDAENRHVALFLAEEGLAFVRNQRDANSIETLNGNQVAFDQEDVTGFVKECFTPFACRVDSIDGFKACNNNPCQEELYYSTNAGYSYDGTLPDSVASGFTRTITIARRDHITDGDLGDPVNSKRGTASSNSADSDTDLLEVASTVSFITNSGIPASVTLRAYLYDVWRLEY